MRILSLIAVLLFSVHANANHHRGHAVALLDQAEGFLLEAQANMEGFGEGYDLAPWYEDAINGWKANIVIALDRVRSIRDDLPEGDLIEIRRDLNQPKYYSSDVSLIRIASGLSTPLGDLVPAILKKDPLRQLRLAIKNVAQARLHISLATWHVQDAINEEVYLDPAFICSGPGRHC